MSTGERLTTQERRQASDSPQLKARLMRTVNRVTNLTKELDGTPLSVSRRNVASGGGVAVQVSEKVVPFAGEGSGTGGLAWSQQEFWMNIRRLGGWMPLGGVA